MSRLLLLRHAKSSWAQAGALDFDRPLNGRGAAAAPLMGRHMAGAGLVPDRVLCSSARRTRETFAAIQPFFPDALDVEFLREIYAPSQSTYLSVLRASGGAAKTLMLIGHNPVIQNTVLALCGGGDLLPAVEMKYPTAGLAVIDLALDDWSQLQPKSGQLTAFFRPRDLEIVGGIDVSERDD